MTSAAPLRLLVFDHTCRSVGVGQARVGLSTAWSSGAVLYRGLNRIDATFGATNWNEAIDWLGTFEKDRSISEIQYWGHGRWGRVLIADDVLDASAFRTAEHPLHAGMMRVRERLTPSSLVWLRTCESFGAERGQDFAQALADGLGVRVAGHTFIIGALQSGLRTLLPGHRPRWSTTEGIKKGSAAEPVTAFNSGPLEPRTVTCFSNQVPRAWFDEDGEDAGGGGGGTDVV